MTIKERVDKFMNDVILYKPSSRKKKVYIAGSLFKEADIKQRKFEKLCLEDAGYDVYNPITDAKFNTDKDSLPTPSDIFMGDYNKILECDIFVVNIDDAIAGDSGVCAEIGIVATLISTGKKNIKVLGVLSDIRLDSANKYSVPSFGMNHFLLGALEKSDATIYKSFGELFKNINGVCGAI